MSEDRRQSGSYVFDTEGNDAAAWIVLEPRGQEPDRLKGWTITFDLSGKLSTEEAQEIAKYLNDNLGDLIIYPPLGPLEAFTGALH